MNILEIKRKIKLLEEERQLLLPIANTSFKTKEEGQKYIEKNYTKLKRLNELNEEIKKLKWELMTPEERAIEEEQMKLYKLKRDGKLGA